jgi:hypothetical protein
MRHVSKKYSSFQLQPRLASKAHCRLILAFRLIQVHILATKKYALEKVDVVLKCSMSAVQLIAMGWKVLTFPVREKTDTDGASQKFRELGKPTSFS